MSESDIVQRLRELEAVESELACECDCPPEATANYQYAMTCAKAADEITRLRAEVEQAQMREACAANLAQEWEQHCKRAEAEVKKLKVNMRAQLADHINGTPCAEIRWQQERETLTARVEELEWALKRMIDLCTLGANPGAFDNGNLDSTGTIDEGDFIAGRIIDKARAAITQETRDEARN